MFPYTRIIHLVKFQFCGEGPFKKLAGSFIVKWSQHPIILLCKQGNSLYPIECYAISNILYWEEHTHACI